MFFFVFILISCTIATSLFLPLLCTYGFVGRDINKIGSQTLVPEPGSIPACLIYLFTLFCLSGESKELIAIFISLTLGLVIGLLDDIYSFGWGTKVVLPLICWIPSRYYLARPKFLRVNLLNYFNLYLPISGPAIVIWEVAIVCLYTFIPNAINIYSGINGLEVGQSLVICLAIHGFGYTECSQVVRFYALYFIAVCLSLLLFNWHPAKMFVGDTFTCFAGIFFANLFLIGYSSLKLIMFFMPQIVNFLVSVPQLIGLVACPRHRTPHVKNSGLLVSSGDLTLVNLVLKLTGPIGERDLVALLLVVQGLVAICAHLIVQ
ncbi:UDP-N-acetylglucosamine--dolichyl-phosphate N-acetylglucosaminephosphotransferase [Babesia microti strain RI]|uniref:UDP-N-acetylglucosamine--dolichyl-phosphate N-acetylglucosaminephosphotransferase n=1 Tax=Babesia microti (strain RI) TaxID=1133968 RepID=A0A1R4A9V4_BABMR|nr:UDP-N-acetylglucosamine--dolichyl-phosphate N-acetylglucosaminephosphotransferase [Babesia microti strain RI]SJK85765.1 UDP-N-acetylglucosamine--dolichyl-phosphate N-acetylglucosaminephosphotransferase [Babesia microti strain RI]|eukprot:XP_021337988.1 UDP-N-acetylglucosamine--dolichyl-phosphate N-acetylglucosaminephosphotransferase [Babesia microti strain RI]